jgi:hypothetical protein
MQVDPPRVISLCARFSERPERGDFVVSVEMRIDAQRIKSHSWVANDPYADVDVIDEAIASMRNQMHESFSRMFFVQEALPFP